ncbi:MAG: hypothetical protein J5643_07220 [Lachnospiraceae bacterium]|nr:hypothetical protein [Lachnospiraceae bacterium]
MTKGELRIFARNGWPVVQTETGAHGEIVYPYVREIKVIYASPEEIRRGFPRERLAAVLADHSGHSFTEVQAVNLRRPTEDEARSVFRSSKELSAYLSGAGDYTYET